MMSMFKRGELKVKSGMELSQITGLDFVNVSRHLDYLNGAFKIGADKLDEQEIRLFSNVHHLTSSA
jgi:hypothetical protein